MPGVTGVELGEALRRIHPDLKILYVSGYTDNAALRRGVQDERLAYLAKPFTPGTLASRVRQILDE